MTASEQKEDTASAPRKYDKQKGFSARHLVNMGVFSAIYYAVFLVIASLGFLGPIFMLVAWGLAVIVNGTVVMLYLSKTPVFGALTMLMTIISLLTVILGHPWYTLPLGAIIGFLGDLVAAPGRYRNRWLNILAYAAVNVYFVVPFLPMFLNSETYFQYKAQTMGAEYADTMRMLFTPWFLVGGAGISMILGIFGGWIGTKILVKHFAKAGIV